MEAWALEMCRNEAIELSSVVMVDHRREDRAVYRVGRGLYVKVYSRPGLAAFERECAGIEFARMAGLGAPAIVLAKRCADVGGVLVTTPAAGQPLAQIGAAVDLDSYGQMLEAVGAWIGKCHSVSGTATNRLLPTTHEAERQAAIRGASGAISTLRRTNCLTQTNAAALETFVADAERECFASPAVAGHGDLNAEHAFVSEGADGRWSCNVIDFESAGMLRQEFDLVCPLLYVLGPCLPGQRFGVAATGFSDHPAVGSFDVGYHRFSERQIPWRAVVCHAVCWNLEVARACWDGSSPQGRSGAIPAICTAVRWASQRFT